MYPTPEAPAKGVFVKNIEQQLLSNGFDVKRVVVPGDPKNKLAKLWGYILYFLRAFYAVVTEDRKVYIHYVAHSGIPLVLASFFRKRHIVSHVHGGDVLPAQYEPKIVRFVKRCLAGKTLALSKQVVVPSVFFKKLLISSYSKLPNAILVSPSGGIDLSKFNFAPSTADFANGRVLNLGYIGRLDRSKGVGTMLLALSKLEFDFRCKIVGDGVLHEWAKKQTVKLGIQDRVQFVGMAEQRHLQQHLKTMHFMIFASERIESLGLVGLEAMATGTPVIGSMMGGMNDYIEPGVNGLGFTCGDASSLTKCITSAKNIEPDIYRDMCFAARRRAEQYDAKICEQQLVEVLS